LADDQGEKLIANLAGWFPHLSVRCWFSKILTHWCWSVFVGCTSIDPLWSSRFADLKSVDLMTGCECVDPLPISKLVDRRNFWSLAESECADTW
jgi:hypothetical protein